MLQRKRELGNWKWKWHIKVLISIILITCWVERIEITVVRRREKESHVFDFIRNLFQIIIIIIIIISYNISPKGECVKTFFKGLCTLNIDNFPLFKHIWKWTNKFLENLNLGECFWTAKTDILIIIFWRRIEIYNLKIQLYNLQLTAYTFIQIFKSQSLQKDIIKKKNLDFPTLNLISNLCLDHLISF